VGRLLQRIVCTADPVGRDGWRVELHGDVAAILALTEDAQHKQERPDLCGSGRLLSVVAGTGFEPVTFRL